jgi:hypothetical protein
MQPRQSLLGMREKTEMSDFVGQTIRVGGSGPSGPPSKGGVRVLGTSQNIKYWEEQGWKLKGYTLEGWYRNMRAAFRGHIKLYDSGDHQYFVVDPPPQLQKHSHGACFRYQGNGTYWVHFNKKPSNVDEGIQTIEVILREAIEQYNI